MPRKGNQSVVLSESDHAHTKRTGLAVLLPNISDRRQDLKEQQHFKMHLCSMLKNAPRLLQWAVGTFDSLQTNLSSGVLPSPAWSL